MPVELTWPARSERADGREEAHAPGQEPSPADLAPDLDPAAPQRPQVLLLGPQLDAISGVSSHLRMLLTSPLVQRYRLRHFQIGSEGRSEGRVRQLLRMLGTPWQLARELRRNPAGIVHINTSLNPRAFWRDAAHLFVARACGARALLQVHGGELPQVFCRRRPVRAAVLRAMLRLTDATVVLARIELDAWRAYAPAAPVTLVPNAVACAPATGAAPRPHQDDGRPGALRLVYVGRLAQEKGLFELLDALALLRREHPHPGHRLVIAGTGPAEAALRRHARNGGLGAQVVFVGSVDERERERLLGASDVFVLPSHAEGLPYALLEAMAAGLPVVATPVGAIPDVLEHGVHGLLVPVRAPALLARALAGLSADRSRLADMGAAGRSRIEATYTVERVAGRFARIYADLGARQAGPSGLTAGLGTNRETRE